MAGCARRLRAEARATLRFETPPGRQLQIDFGETRVSIGGESVRVYLFVATLGYSRRIFVQAFRHERQSAWFDGIEAAFAPFRRGAAGGAARQRPGAGRPARRGDARGAVQRAAARLRALLGLPAAGLRAVPGADQGQGRARRRLRQAQRDRRPPLRQLGGARGASCRGGCARSPTCAIHGTTGEPPIERFGATRRRRCGRSTAGRRSGRCASSSAGSRPTATIEVDTNCYSVPWRLIGETVAVVVAGGRVSIRHGGARGRRPRRDDRPAPARDRSPPTSKASVGRPRPGARSRPRRPRSPSRARSAAAAVRVRAGSSGEAGR